MWNSSGERMGCGGHLEWRSHRSDMWMEVYGAKSAKGQLLNHFEHKGVGRESQGRNPFARGILVFFRLKGSIAQWRKGTGAL